MVEIYKTVSRAAPTDATVVIEGETGTGKELVARMIHRNSRRAAQPFVPVDCGSIAPSLLESELFGAMRGAFTGADRDRVGVFEAANRGTVFLDEIGEIEMNFQLALLRFLQEHEIRPVGASRSKEVDVRVIAATNRDLQRMVEEEKFREDLWYRLNTVRIFLPPLRERRGDIPLLARFYPEQVQRAVRARCPADGFGREGAAGLHLAGERAAVAAHDRAADDSGRPRSMRRRCMTRLTAMESREKPVETLADAEEDQIRRGAFGDRRQQEQGRADARDRAEDAVPQARADEALARLTGCHFHPRVRRDGTHQRSRSHRNAHSQAETDAKGIGDHVADFEVRHPE